MDINIPPSISSWGQVSFQNSSSPIMEFVSEVHDWIFMVLLFVVSLVVYVMVTILVSKNFFYKKNLISAEQLEFIWAGIPALFLLGLAIPSLHCLYLMDEILSSVFCLSVIGHQWYWSYQFDSLTSLSFDSYMKVDNFQLSDFRLLDVDQEVILPVLSNVRVLVTSDDVIHSWTIPKLGVKMDAIPGRLNQFPLFSSMVGTAYGQCSEICGANHSFMPIKVSFLKMNHFIKWVKSLI